MIYRFGSHSLDVAAYELRQDDRVVPLQPKAWSLLEHLLRNADRAVSKEELLEEVWPAVQVGEQSIIQAVSLARRALADEDGQIIQTVRGRGYRIGVPVQFDAGPEAELRSPARRRRVALITLAIAVGVSLAWLGRPRLEPPTVPPVTSEGRPPLTSIVVLPFADLSPAGDQVYFAEGLAEEVIHLLAKSSELRVVARTSAFAFRGTGKDVRTIGARLSVGSVLEGSVRKEEDRLRVTAQLIQADTGFHLWSETYDRRGTKGLSVQNDIARVIAEGVTAELLEASPAAVAASSPDFRAYQLYLRGRARSGFRSAEAIREAVTLFEDAIEADPGYADAHAALAHALVLEWDYDSTEPRSGPLLARAEVSAQRAVALAPHRAPGHASLANVRAVRHHDWAGAEEGYRRAIELNPGLAAPRESYASLLMQLGRLDDAHPQLLRALELDPLSPILNRNLGRYHLYAGDYEQAVAFFWRGLELDPDDRYTPVLLWIAYTQMGKEAEAVDALAGFLPPPAQPALRVVARVAGLPAAVGLGLGTARLQDPCPIRAVAAAQAYAYLGWTESMYTCLEASVDSDPSYFAVNPLFAPYRSEPRFLALAEQVGIELP